ncbi:MAG: hypothetical protein WBK91_09945 [Alphaproteobacteria bacterium]
MITLTRVLPYLRKITNYIGAVGLAYLAYASLVYVAWTTIKPWSATTACFDVCNIDFCGCPYVDTLYNETFFLIGLRASWAVVPFLGHVFPGIS